MKKIFTLILTCGILTAASAQQSRHSYKMGTAFNSQSYGPEGHHQANGSEKVYGSTPYSHSESWNYQSNDRRDEHGYGNSRDREYGNLRDRDGDRDRDDRGDRYDGRGFDHVIWDHYSHDGPMKKKGIQMLFGFNTR